MASTLRKLFFPAPEPTTPEGGSSNAEGLVEPDSKAPAEAVHPSSSSEQTPDEAAQDGVAQAEAITLVWTKTMWCLYFVNAFQSQITSNASAYITSDFESHSLIPVIAIVSSIMGAATYMPLAKILNLWDRSVGFALMTGFATLGLILSATCYDIATYCAAQVFYSVGFAGIIFSIDVITIDTSTLRDRGLAYAFTSSPYIITAYAGPAAAAHFVQTNWRWGYGIFCIILPVVATPLFCLLQWNRHVAKKRGLLRAKESSGRTPMQSAKHYIIEFDILGTFLLTAGLALFLLPFTIASTTDKGWNSASMIVMLVIGILCLFAFAAVERWVAPVPFLQWEMLATRTILGACLVDATYQISYYCWNDYWTSYLQVVYGVSIETAGYISNIFDVVSGVWLLGVGLCIKKTGRFRWLLLWAVPLYILGIGLMIYFRQPHWGVGYNVMCQVFLALSGGTMIIVQQVAVLAVADHNNAASALAFLNVFGNMGSAVGSSISGAIWTHTLPSALRRLLPDEAKADWETIYDSLDVQLSYERGTPIRAAIQAAYAFSQSKMLIAGTCIMALSLGWMFLIKDLKVTKAQTKGVLF
ncbi:Siderophore iron transporter mirB [Lasiodiplodia theobromae]|uniref:Siderophore iron transporter mirB n=1 Tax=Lasiodiplodia theobromae TaxID=45133 RepID=A0A5N5CYA8_9PEZI|nr:Siderophore iron transporter mirB [Lasiodiplodia theobromae]